MYFKLKVKITKHRITLNDSFVVILYKFFFFLQYRSASNQSVPN
uniref:Uncharacterized protein n=1 Tax=Rhizophora mucronata TaxID=61149 RepID=A0A2P2Q5G1_RHIMU